MKDIITIAVVNFTAIWGDKEANLRRIEEFVEAAGKRGADLIVLPETALTGYELEADVPREEEMHARLAETIPGPSTSRIEKICAKYGMYAVFGMAEKEDDDPSVIYNAAAFVGPEGTLGSYRKLHLPFDEALWAQKGTEPALFDTPWGPVGVSICYDTYCFPELIRYYRAKGARLCLNVTACPDSPCTKAAAAMSIPTNAYINYVFIASADLCGTEKNIRFYGGSGVVGPNNSKDGCYTYIGKCFGDKASDQPEMFLGTIDLSMADYNTDLPIYRYNPLIEDHDWRPDLYAKMAADVADSWKKD